MASSTATRASGRPSSLRPPARPSSSRLPPSSRSASSSAYGRSHDRSRAASPADSLISTASGVGGTKRKDREYESLDPNVAQSLTPSSRAGSDETNINVVVRCRGRNDREVRENSNVVIGTDAIKGTVVDISSGPNSLSDKSYHFDRVFSPAADQGMVFEDVVRPILEEMLAGYNCTIFAYGQTGTGKTYTMSGDMTETLGMLSDAAGIIPRVLQALFQNLQTDDAENCVKVSFIELYNEELRDLISVEETAKLKIYDDNSRKNHATTMVQGMEEKFIKNAAEGIKLLQDGSVKRQVAATKCNDLSSRSHTVFTITACVKRNSGNSDEADDFVCAGKLNLVDLAGSENIQRSGAENKRAAEAGLINKSLLTLGRVINALVDRSAHIPYRESKLTRLLQDSLGGRTKTCIIATISPAKSNLEETISTLDYAFRAKNIRNKPQINLRISKRALLQDFANEIEKLKGELITTRQRNGVYLSNDAYEEMTAVSESRRIVMGEQAGKIEILEANLKNKVQELYTLTSTFMGLKRDHEGTKSQLDETQNILDQTEIVLDEARKSLEQEATLRLAHQETEAKLATIGSELLSTLGQTVGDLDGLHAKNRRRSELHAQNRAAWTQSQHQVHDITELVEQQVQQAQQSHLRHVDTISRFMDSFVRDEEEELTSTRTFLDEQLQLFVGSREDLTRQEAQSKEEMDSVLEEIKVIRDAVKQRMGESLQSISGAAQRIAADVVSELTVFHSQLHTSYSSLGQEFKSVLESLLQQVQTQRDESSQLRRQLLAATKTMAQQNALLTSTFHEALAQEKRRAAQEREEMMAQWQAMLRARDEAQEARWTEQTATLQRGLTDASGVLGGAVGEYVTDMDEWEQGEQNLAEQIKRTRDTMKTRLREDWLAVNGRSMAIQEAVKSVHEHTVDVVDEQVADLDVQMEALDDFVSRARAETSRHQERFVDGMRGLGETVEGSLAGVGEHVEGCVDRARGLGERMRGQVERIHEEVAPLDEAVCGRLRGLREEIGRAKMHEYEPTGATPAKVQYTYPTTLPRTGVDATMVTPVRVSSSSLSTPTSEKATPPTVVYVDSPNPAADDGQGLSDVESDVESDAEASGAEPSSDVLQVAEREAESPQADLSKPKSPSRSSSQTVSQAQSLSSSLSSSVSSSISSVSSISSLSTSSSTSANAPPSRRPSLSQFGPSHNNNNNHAHGPPLKKSRSMQPTRMPRSISGILLAEGRENVPPSLGSRRKSPRLN